MNLLEIKTSGKMCIFLSKIPSLTIEEYLSKAKANYYNAMKEEGFRFYSIFLKQEKQSNSYPMISEEDIENSFIKKYESRFNRLKVITDDIYYYSLKITSSDSATIMEYAKQERINRVIVFLSRHLQRDEKRLLKILKLNSFLYYRDANFYYAQNLFNPTGYIRKEKLNQILEGKAKLSSESTFRMIELEMDQEIGSNLIKIRYVN